MKNKFLYLIVALATLAFTGCQKTTEGMTRITYYATVDLIGGPEVVYIGESFVDEGCYAEMNGEDVTDQVITTNNINNNRIGVYQISYSVINKDGFPGGALRTVYVVNPSSIANLYLGESEFGTRHYYDAPIYITDNGDGTYKVDDLLGGLMFYGLNPGLEPAYDFHAEGSIAIAPDNTVSQVGPTGAYYFGGSNPVSVTSGTFNPDTRTFYLNVNYGATPGKVTLRSITK